MSSSQLGTSTSETEVTNVSKHGLWLLTSGRELYLPYDEFPWFRHASIQDVFEVEEPQPGHFYWPGLEVDLTLDSIEHSERYPLVAKV